MPRSRALGLALALCVLACGVSRESGPVEVHWDRDACAHCNMGISEPRHAAQVRLPGARRPALFDDPGCALLWLAAQPDAEADRAAVWVRSPDGESWVDGRSARFADGARTPMDYGFATVAGTQGGSLTLDQVALRIAERERERRDSRN